MLIFLDFERAALVGCVLRPVNDGIETGSGCNDTAFS